MVTVNPDPLGGKRFINLDGDLLHDINGNLMFASDVASAVEHFRQAVIKLRTITLANNEKIECINVSADAVLEKLAESFPDVQEINRGVGYEVSVHNIPAQNDRKKGSNRKTEKATREVEGSIQEGKP